MVDPAQESFPFSASGISSVIRQFSAAASLSTVAMVTFRFPRSTMLTNAR
jgi:hypothetical protein